MLMELFRRVRGHPDVDKVDGNEKQMKFDIEELLVEFQDLLEQKCNDFCFGEDSLLLSDSSKHGGWLINLLVTLQNKFDLTYNEVGAVKNQIEVLVVPKLCLRMGVYMEDSQNWLSTLSSQFFTKVNYL